MNISSHLPILQVVIPLMAAPLCVMLRKGMFSWLLASSVCWLSLIISCVLCKQVLESGDISYAIGGWISPGGIEYHVDILNAFVLIIVSGIAAIVSLFSRESVNKEIPGDRIYLFYASFLLCLTGLLGVVITGDAFNMFVFIGVILCFFTTVPTKRINFVIFNSLLFKL